MHKGDTHYVAECIGLPVVTQAKSLDELVENIKEAIAVHLEDEDPSEFDLDSDPSILASFELERLIHVGAVKRSTKSHDAARSGRNQKTSVVRKFLS